MSKKIINKSEQIVEHWQNDLGVIGCGYVIVSQKVIVQDKPVIILQVISNVIWNEQLHYIFTHSINSVQYLCEYTAAYITFIQ